MFQIISTSTKYGLLIKIFCQVKEKCPINFVIFRLSLSQVRRGDFTSDVVERGKPLSVHMKCDDLQF